MKAAIHTKKLALREIKILEDFVNGEGKWMNIEYHE